MCQSLIGMRECFVIGPRCEEWFVPEAHLRRIRGVTLAGCSHLRPPFHIARRCPDHALVLATVRGRCRMETGGRVMRLGPGSVFFGPAGVAHDYQIEGAEWRMAWLHLRAGAPGLKPEDGPWLQERHPCCGILDAALRALARSRHRDVVWYDALARVVEGAWAPSEPAGSGPGILDAAWEDVRSRPQAGWTVEALCRTTGYSRAQLHRISVREVGTSPLRQVARIRMERARDLLTRGQLRMAAIAAAVGYADEFAFSAAYKRHFGEPPSRARRTGA